MPKAGNQHRQAPVKFALTRPSLSACWALRRYHDRQEAAFGALLFGLLLRSVVSPDGEQRPSGIQLAGAG
jgi:hypothetical protein